MKNKSIKWQYFFGGSINNGRSYDRYYKSEIKGIRVEKHVSNRGVRYAVGNIDKAKIKHKTEEELINHLIAPCTNLFPLCLSN